MCKLCNTDRPSMVNYKPKLPKTKAFVQVVLEYLGELPCYPCIRTADNKWDRDIKSVDNLDKYILNKLRKAYYGPITRKESRISESVLGVVKRVSPYSGYICFTAKVVRSNKVMYIGNFPTLQEALQAKLNYCIKYNHTKALKNIQNKLKELQNETNKS